MSKIWFNGEFVPWDEANVHVLTHSLHYGAAVFEGIRAYECADGGSAVFRLKEHVDRLFDSAHILYMKIPYTREQITQACIDVLKVNGMKNGYIRPLVYLGYGAMGVLPADNPVEVAIAAWPWGAYLGEGALEKGIRVKTSSFSRHHVNVMMTKAKACGNYVNSVLAKVEAHNDGYDEALMLDTTGHVSEATGANVFIVKGGRIKTTPLPSILGGITRDCLVTLAREKGYHVVKRLFTRDELYIADEVFLCGTAAELTPVREADGRTIGQGVAGPVAKELQEAFFDAALGKNPKYAHWLTPYEVS